MEAAVRDLFAEKDLGTFKGKLTLEVDIHDVRMVKVTPLESSIDHESWRPWHESFHATPSQLSEFHHYREASQ